MALKKSKNKFVGILAVLFLTLVVMGFFWKVFLKGSVPMPGDLVVGAYFPWLEEKWGYEVGVPIKNPLISDVFSTTYVWKQIIGESIRAGEWPLWNPYSYSGYPLLANLYSGVMNPFNLLFAFLGTVNGWCAWMVLSILGEVLGMYWFLRVKKITRLPSIIGSIAFGFSGYSILWNQYTIANVAMMWWPVSFGLIDKFFETENKKYLWFFPIVGFLIIAAGHFQICVYSVMLFLSYFGWKWRKNKIKISPKFWIFLIVTTILISLPQVLPIIQMGMKSVRFDEGYIKEYNYGLLPLANLITMIAPDFFGNPTTYNYWGFFNYLETNFYVGVVGFLALIWAIFNFKKMGEYKYFVVLAIMAVFLAFDTPIGKMIYWLKVPGLSTSAAGRIASVLVFSVSILTAVFVEEWQKIKWREMIRIWWGVAAAMGITAIIVLILKRKFEIEGNVEWGLRMNSSWRNLVLPGLLMVGFGVVSICRRHKIGQIGLLILMTADLFRFGWKWTPFVDRKMIFPANEIINFLRTPGGDYFRVEREKGEIFPPNVWTAYHIMSPSGYDPMAPKEYTTAYEKVINLNKEENPGVSRYLELNKYNAEGLGEFNVKYLWVVKRDKDNKIFGDTINKDINLKEWKKIKETKGTVLLENLKYKPRVLLIDETGMEDGTNVYIEEYKNNSVKIKFDSKKPNQRLILRDSWDDGWKAKVNGKTVKVEKYDGVFRQVTVPEGAGEVDFVYFPDSFKIGLLAALGGIIMWLWGFFKSKKIE